MPERGVELSSRKEHATIEEHLVAIEGLDRDVGVRKIRITGGEPLVRKDAVELVARIRRRFPNAELGMTTNGVYLEELAVPLKAAGLHRVNISIDSLDRERFHRLTRRDQLPAVLRGIDAAIAAELTPVKLNVVMVRSVNIDEFPALVRFAARKGAQVRFIELMEIGESGFDQRAEFVSADEAIERVASALPLRLLGGLHGVARPAMVTVDGVEHEVGFISPVTEPFCSSCDRMRIDALGRMHSCLMAEDPRDSEQAGALYAAKEEPSSSWQRRASMSSIGG
jgi:cyclic pyranopterin phosphate synthase